MAITFNNVVPFNGEWEKALDSFKKDVCDNVRKRFGRDAKDPEMKLIFPVGFTKDGPQVKIEGDTSRLFIYSDSIIKFFSYSDCNSNRETF